MSGAISAGDRELAIRALVPGDARACLEVHSHQPAAGPGAVAGQRIRCAPAAAAADVLPEVGGVDLLDGPVRGIEEPEADHSSWTIGLRRQVYALGFIIHRDPRAIGWGRPRIERVRGAGGEVDDMDRTAIDGRQVRVGVMLAVR